MNRKTNPPSQPKIPCPQPRLLLWPTIRTKFYHVVVGGGQLKGSIVINARHGVNLFIAARKEIAIRFAGEKRRAKAKFKRLNKRKT